MAHHLDLEERQAIEILQKIWLARVAEQVDTEVSLLAQLEAVRSDLAEKRTGLEALRVRLGAAPVEHVAATESTMGQLETSLEDDGETDDENGDESEDPGAPPRVRTPSLVAKIVSGGSQPMTREDIRREFRDRDLIPSHWVNPTNTISTAIARAKVRGWIVEVEPNLYGPGEQFDA